MDQTPTLLSQLPAGSLRDRPELLELAYVFLNPVEFHGSHLSLQTDYLISWGLAHRLHSEIYRERGFPFVVGAVLDIGVDPAPGPGSVHTPLKEVRGAILRVCQSLQRRGVKRVIFMTFHGSPGHAAALEAGIEWLKVRGVPALNPFNILLTQIRDYDPRDFSQIFETIPDLDLREKFIQNGWKDFHGGLLETSVALHLAPDSVSPAYRTAPDCPDRVPLVALQVVSRIAGWLGKKNLKRELEIAADAVAWTRLRPHLGYTGCPRFASAEIGSRVTSRLLSEYMKAVRAVFDHGRPSPAPILQWTVKVTGSF